MGRNKKKSTNFQQLIHQIGRLSKCDCRVTVQIQLNYKIHMNIVFIFHEFYLPTTWLTFENFVFVTFTRIYYSLKIVIHSKSRVIFSMEVIIFHLFICIAPHSTLQRLLKYI